MVKHEIWMTAMKSKAGMLCIGCLETRLERNLTNSDFLPCALNKETKRFKKSDRLKDRLSTV